MQRRISWGAALLVGTAGCHLIGDLHEGKDIGEIVACKTVDECLDAAPACGILVACDRGTCLFDEHARKAEGAKLSRIDCVEELASGAGGDHTCALLKDGTVKCWGSNGWGELGLSDGGACGAPSAGMTGALPHVALGGGRTAIAIAAGTTHTCAILDEGSVKCWGGNSFGQLGLGDSDGRGDGMGEMGDNLPVVELSKDRKAVSIAAGAAHTCAILEDGSVKCWGHNDYGQLGLGDRENRGDEPDEMGDALPAIDLGRDRTAVLLAAGTMHTCALLDDDTVKCWGRNDEGQLGVRDKHARGDDPAEMGDRLDPLDLGDGRPTSITAGAAHACALLAGGEVMCWGGNLTGQIAIGDPFERVHPVKVDWGTAAVAIVAGTGNTCVLRRGGSVGCWGLNPIGPLDNDGDAREGNFCRMTVSDLRPMDLGPKPARALTAGSVHTCALLVDHTVKCWGANHHGQLGLDDRRARCAGADEMGDKLPKVKLYSSIQ